LERREMSSEERASEAPEASPQENARDGNDAAEQRSLSRLERLKKKIRRLQGKDPDIYPMW
jgi:hypothetical protein